MYYYIVLHIIMLYDVVVYNVVYVCMYAYIYIYIYISHHVICGRAGASERLGREAFRAARGRSHRTVTLPLF